jgi:hypothetical protein
MSPVRTFLGLLLALVAALSLSADDKPDKQPPYKRLLQGDDATKAERLEQHLYQHWAAGKFEDALKAAEELVSLREKLQGADHWEAANARWDVEIFRRTLKQEAKGRKEMAGILAQFAEAQQLEAQGRYREAKPLRERILPVSRKVLGEEHPYTAGSYNSLAVNLYSQGQYAAAAQLHEKALDIRRKVLGEEHPFTAVSYNNLAANLDAQGQHATAVPLHQKALDTYRKVLGEEHPATATSYNSLAVNLDSQGQHTEAALLHRKALDIRRKVLGEEHPDTATSYNNLAFNLNAQGRFAAAMPLLQRALDIHRKLLGEEHPLTASDYNNVAVNLNAQGQYAAAAPLLQKALDIRRKVLGEEHPFTATTYNNLAANLRAQSQYAQAVPLYQRALEIRRKTLGEGHPHTAASYDNLALDLNLLRQYALATPLHEKALDIYRKVLGEEHRDTAICYDNLACNLNAQGQYKAATPLYQKALDIHRKVLGEEHPGTATSYNNLANNLGAQGEYAAAAPSYQKALDICRQLLGEEHPYTASGYNNRAGNRNAQGEYALAEEDWTRAAAIFARTRLQVAATGLERATATSEDSPLPNLAAALARNGKPALAWERFEQSIGRGAWDDMSARLRRAPTERSKQHELVAQLNRLDLLIQRTIKPQDTPELRKQREALLTQRRDLGDELARFTAELEAKYGPVAGQVYERAIIQKVLPADAALVGWIDIPGQPKAANPNGEHWAFLLRSSGEPIVVGLTGSGDKGVWTENDTKLPRQLREALQNPKSDWQPLAKKLRAQRLEPLAKHLAGVQRLIVLPSPALAGVPVEVFADGYTVSYALSGTMFAYLRQRPRPGGNGMLALADPVFDKPGTRKPEPLPLPPGGLLLLAVTPNSNAANAKLQAGDVLLKYAGADLKTPADLLKLVEAHAGNKEITVTVWRDGRSGERLVGPGNLGVVLAKDPAPVALAEKRKNDDLLARARSGDDGQWDQLPGTRVEAEALRRLCDKGKLAYRLLADSDASEQELDALATSRELGKYRFIHLATHGTLDDRFPLRSAVILSRDNLPDALQQAQAGKPVYDGRMTAEKVLGSWHLDAELVTLSACQTALGKYERGEGFVGFSQALLLSGSRNVCLSLWKVDDTATALLMERFYENLLIGRAGSVSDRSKVAALEEAKSWLRNLSADDVTKRAASLTNGVARGKGRPALPLLPAATVKPATKDKPFAHPYYWAAFVLVGDGE